MNLEMGRKTTKFTHFKRKKASHTTSVPKVTTGNSASSVPDNTVLELWNGYKASLYDKYSEFKTTLQSFIPLLGYNL